MPFVLLKFLHVAFVFMGVAFAIGPAAFVFVLVRSGDRLVFRRALGTAEQLFQISTGCYGAGIVLGFAAALTSSLDLSAHWLITAYVLVVLLGIHGILFDRWTKRLDRVLAGNNGEPVAPRDAQIAKAGYLLGGMVVLVVLIVYVMVTKVTIF